jgi:S1-C subfamily serine protease
MSTAAMSLARKAGIRDSILYCWAFIAALGAGTAQAQDTAATTRAIFSSLALVIDVRTDGGVSTGTAFCIYSTKFKSYFLTNQHVIDNSKELLLRPPGYWRFMNGRVFPRERYESLDLAVVVIDVGDIPSVTLFGSLSDWVLPREGFPIGIAGYPSFRFQGVNGLDNVQPSVHFGTINARTGIYFEFDAVTDHGNSGGPIFDAKSGKIAGVVTAVVP